MGKITNSDEKLIEKCGLSEIIELIDYCSHEKALEYNHESDFLIIVLANKNWDYWIPGKTFEYISSSKKVLAIVPENGSCAEIIKKTETGFVVAPDNIEKISEMILNLVNENFQQIEPNQEEIAKYHRKNLTEKLAKVFEKITTL